MCCSMQSFTGHGLELVGLPCWSAIECLEECAELLLAVIPIGEAHGLLCGIHHVACAFVEPRPIAHMDPDGLEVVRLLPGQAIISMPPSQVGSGANLYSPRAKDMLFSASVVALTFWKVNPSGASAYLGPQP